MSRVGCSGIYIFVEGLHTQKGVWIPIILLSELVSHLNDLLLTS